MFEKEEAFYMSHQAKFREKYPDKWLVIVGDSLFGAFDTTKEAFETAILRYEPGEFMMHRPADDGTMLEIGPIISIHRPDDDPEPESVVTVSGGGLMAFTHA
ncbi:hypothetical protein AGMMS49942_17680 [Spirochaetia bacterium]|nr:hypothetical protein AGMMS49942_17680 [Spirochaetia bacterium]